MMVELSKASSLVILLRKDTRALTCDNFSQMWGNGVEERTASAMEENDLYGNQVAENDFCGAEETTFHESAEATRKGGGVYESGGSEISGISL